MSNLFSAKNRAALVEQLKHDSYDLIVIGGGITGAGIALDASARGLKVLLLDMQDFCAGTSSRSTKLIHGGLRYLKQLDFKLVAEVGREREIIYRNAPHLTRPEPMLLPITKHGSFGRITTKLAMLVYELLAGVKSNERHRSLNAREVIEIEPLLKKDELLSGILFYEYRTDDARLTLSVLKEAVNRGALALNYLKVTGFVYEQGKIAGVKAVDQLSNASYQVRARYVVNASGPWVDELDSLDDKTHDNKLQLTKGVHLVVDHVKLPVRQSVYIDTYDNRMMFVIPRDGKTYLGTTDTFYDGDKANPIISAEDKSYVLKCVNEYFPGSRLVLTDVESGWAGIRPLIKKQGKRPSEISRRDEIFEWPSGLITIAGGKLTGYRKMAQRIVDLLAEKIAPTDQQVLPACSTGEIILSGGKLGSINFHEFTEKIVAVGIFLGVTSDEARTLACRYGSETHEMFAMMKALKEEENGVEQLPLLLRAEVLYAIEHEMCVSPSDFFIRRTGMLYFDIATVKKHKASLITYMSKILQWDQKLMAQFDSELQQAVTGAQQ